MKIFTGFDTKFDEKELQRAIQEYGSGNAILTKKHWIFLFLPLLFLLLSIGIFLLMIKVSSVQYLEDNPMLFWSVASGQCLVTFFRIIHSIQTILSIMRKYKGHAYF